MSQHDGEGKEEKGGWDALFSKTHTLDPKFEREREE